MSINLIEEKKNPTPDYYCTWQTQLYACSNGGPEKQRENITEESLFGKGRAQGWANFYDKARRDLLLVMDDSWAVPISSYENYYGSLVLNREKFPSFYREDNPGESLKALADKIKEIGWKGLGGWVCAQESPVYSSGNTEEYWTERLKWCQDAGFSYWKVDWGEKAKSLEFRKMLTDLQKKYAPGVIIEHAMLPDAITFGDVFRTYDVPAIMSIPMTMQKTADCLIHTDGGMINCEDEAYIAAALGCVMGIMHHPMTGSLPNGNPDLSFPSLHRNLKTKITEITRAARWHRMAPAFGVKKNETKISETSLTDYWNICDQNAEIEKWWGYESGSTIEKSAPAAISRNMEIPKIKPDKNGFIPYAVASKNPNGIISVATLGRTLGRSYFIPKCEITLDGGKADTFGIFGEYDSLVINMQNKPQKIFIQDIASDCAVDITGEVYFSDSGIFIDGEIIHNVGTAENGDGDTSEPGAVIKLVF